MKEIDIHTFTEFHEVIVTYDERTIIYRGMKSVKYPPIPKLGRILPPESIGSREENGILRWFKERACGFLDFMPASNTACPPVSWTGPIIRWSPAILQSRNPAKTAA
jgi:hypothetical protein